MSPRRASRSCGSIGHSRSRSVGISQLILDQLKTDSDDSEQKIRVEEVQVATPGRFRVSLSAIGEEAKSEQVKVQDGAIESVKEIQQLIRELEEMEVVQSNSELCDVVMEVSLKLEDLSAAIARSAPAIEKIVSE